MNPLLIPLVVAVIAAVALLVWGLTQRHEARGWQELHLEYLRRAGHRAFAGGAPATNNGASSATSTPPAAEAAADQQTPAAAADHGPPPKRIERWPL